MDFKDSGHDGHLWFLIETILTIFLSTDHPDASYQDSVGLSVQDKKRKNDFQDGSHFGFPIETILAIFDLLISPMLPT